MTIAELTKVGEVEAKRVAIRFDAAKAIRKALDDARKTYGAEAWDSEGIEESILEMVSGEVES